MHVMSHFIFCYYRYMDARCTVISCSHITTTYAHYTSTQACIVSHLSSYDSPFILDILLFHVTVFMFYDCFLLLIWIFLLLDMRAVDMRYVGIPHLLFSFPGILFMLSCSCYIVLDSRYIVLHYQQSSGPVIMLPVSCTVVVLVTLYT